MTEVLSLQEYRDLANKGQKKPQVKRTPGERVKRAADKQHALTEAKNEFAKPDGIRVLDYFGIKMKPGVCAEWCENTAVLNLNGKKARLTVEEL